MDNQRSLKEIAEEITRDWQYPHHDAIPYLIAMLIMNSIDDQEFEMLVVALFLCNAGSWHGPMADRIRKELNTLFFMWYEDGKR